jgi:hypothetical protein
MISFIIICLLSLQAQDLGETDPPSLKQLILSKNVREREQAYRYAMTGVIGMRRQRSKAFLLNVVRADPLMPPKNGPINGEEAQHSPRRIALSILAEWHDPTLTTIFLEFLDYDATDPNRSGFWLGPIPNETYAAVKGLINIGKPAIQPCLVELTKKENNPEVVRYSNPPPGAYNRAGTRQANLLFVLRTILGDEEAKNAMEREIPSLTPTDSDRAKNLHSALNVLETSIILKRK